MEAWRAGGAVAEVWEAVILRRLGDLAWSRRARGVGLAEVVLTDAWVGC